MGKYVPTDCEAYRYLTLITRWARKYRKFDGNFLPAGLIRAYLSMCSIGWSPHMEHRIYQESGRYGNFKAQEKRRREYLKKVAEESASRQGDFGF